MGEVRISAYILSQVRVLPTNVDFYFVSFQHLNVYHFYRD